MSEDTPTRRPSLRDRLGASAERSVKIGDFVWHYRPLSLADLRACGLLAPALAAGSDAAAGSGLPEVYREQQRAQQAERAQQASASELLEQVDAIHRVAARSIVAATDPEGQRWSVTLVPTEDDCTAEEHVPYSHATEAISAIGGAQLSQFLARVRDGARFRGDLAATAGDR
jgi:hypothetical protein